MTTCKHFDFDELRQYENKEGLQGKVATHHLKLYHLVSAMDAPTVVEFGVDKGRSTCVLLHACETRGGHLVSIDINDCSDVAESDAWTFIQQSDQNIDEILQMAPSLRDGIDLLHIDSLHTRSHVDQLLKKWFPYIKPNGYITFHDIDPTPYLKAQRKDNARHEAEAIGISNLIKEFFYANEDHLFLEYHFGSTGFGIMKNLSPLGTQPHSAIPIHSRQLMFSFSRVMWALRWWLSSRLAR